MGKESVPQISNPPHLEYQLFLEALTSLQTAYLTVNTLKL